MLKLFPQSFQHPVQKGDLEGKIKLVLMTFVSCFLPKHGPEALTLQTNKNFQTISLWRTPHHLHFSVRQSELLTVVSAPSRRPWGPLAAARGETGSLFRRGWFYFTISERKGNKVLLVKMTKINTNI